MPTNLNYIFGRDVLTSAGYLSPIKVEEYETYSPSLSMMAMDKTYIVYSYLTLPKSPEVDEVISHLVDMDLYEIVQGIPNFMSAYETVYEKVFLDKKDIDNIAYENFDEVRKTILEMNCLSEESAMINLDKSARSYLDIRVQKAVERSKRVKANESSGEDSPELEDIITSVVVGAGKSFEEISNWTMYQLYASFNRFAQIKTYESSTLFATVASDVNIESWSKRLNLFAKDSHSIKDGADLIATKKK